MRRPKLLVSPSSLNSVVLLFVLLRMSALVKIVVSISIPRIMLCSILANLMIVLAKWFLWSNPYKLLLPWTTFLCSILILARGAFAPLFSEVIMTWLANNWEAIMTLINTIGLLFVHKNSRAQ